MIGVKGSLWVCKYRVVADGLARASRSSPLRSWSSPDLLATQRNPNASLGVRRHIASQNKPSGSINAELRRFDTRNRIQVTDECPIPPTPIGTEGNAIDGTQPKPAVSCGWGIKRRRGPGRATANARRPPTQIRVDASNNNVRRAAPSVKNAMLSPEISALSRVLPRQSSISSPVG